MLLLGAGCAALAMRAGDAVGANVTWTTYEAEAMKGTGEILGPRYDPHRVETEASGQRCVRLGSSGEFVEFAAGADANAMVVRYSLRDATAGGGVESALSVFVNGRAVRTLTLTSHYSWLYGNYPFSNRPGDEKPRNFYDEIRLKDLNIAAGDVVRVEKIGPDAFPCIVDFVDLENVPPPLAAPADAFSVFDFGAVGDGQADDTAALRACIAAAERGGGVVWVPPGEYKLTGDVVLTAKVAIQGAGMWHTTFVGDDALYAQSDRRVRFKLSGREIRLADFAIVGKLNYRNDSEPNDGIVGAGCAESFIERVWVEHTKAGVWVYNGTDLRIEGCRFRNLIADGVNLCVGTSRSVIENCTARGTGDDCFAIWPAAPDQGFVGEGVPGNNIIRRCTGQLTFLANGAAVYGGANNRVEDCLFTDISTGCGILISTTFPTTDEARRIDNNFTGTTVIRNCELRRCGGYDHGWAWRGSLQICLDRRSIAGESAASRATPNRDRNRRS
ncbi:MAG TPA: glycosyl hydrolase family 28-related protein, partial [Opitutus sp.]|nr:glycosyl hydrolase family 28-related protein [Opitutus sp.]